MRDLAISYATQKRTDNQVKYLIMLLDDEQPTPLDDSYTYKAMIDNQESLVTPNGVDLTIADQQLVLDSAQLNLPAGVYRFEVWVEKDGQRAIYPDDHMVRLTINRNATDLPNGTVSSLTLDEFVKQFKELAKHAGGGANVKLDVTNRTITVDDQTLTIPQAVDLSNVVTSDDLTARLANYVTSDQLPQPVDLTGYLKETDAEQKYVSRGLPTSLRVVTTNMKDIYYLFDNGSELHFGNSVKGDSGQLTVSGGYGNLLARGWSWGNASNNIASYLNGSLLLSEIKSHPSSDFASWKGCYVVNPIRNANGYDYSTAKIYKDAPIGTNGEIDMIKSWYACGLFTEQQIESLGAVKK